MVPKTIQITPKNTQNARLLAKGAMHIKYKKTNRMGELKELFFQETPNTIHPFRCEIYTKIWNRPHTHKEHSGENMCGSRVETPDSYGKSDPDDATRSFLGLRAPVAVVMDYRMVFQKIVLVQDQPIILSLRWPTLAFAQLFDFCLRTIKIITI